MSTDQERSDASDRVLDLLFDGLRHGASSYLTRSPYAVVGLDDALWCRGAAAVHHDISRHS